MPRNARTLGGLVAVTLLLSCCGGDGGGDGEGGVPSTAPVRESTTAPAADDPARVPSAGCRTATAAPAVDVARQNLDVEGTGRWFLLSAPTSDEEPLPLVLSFHGLFEGAEVHARTSDLSTVAAEEDFVVAFPNGTGNPVAWKAGDPDGNPDLTFTTELIDAVASERCIDTSRVYAMGFSNGAMMTSLVACALPDRVAAVAPVAGLTIIDGCEPDRPVPALTFHGTADPILLFNGGVDASRLPGGSGEKKPLPPPDLDGEGYPASVGTWAERNGCEADPTDDQVTEEVTRRTYDCPSGADVVFDIVIGGGHSWPGSDFTRSIESIVGPTTFDVDASRDAWAFFEPFRLPAR